METHAGLNSEGVLAPGEVPAAPRGVATKVRIAHLGEMKRVGRKIVMVTAYDSTFASIVDESGIDMILVGDSVGNVFHGFSTTLPVTMEMMILHTAAVTRPERRALVVADLPFMAYQVCNEDAVRNAGRLVKEGGAEAVKLEGRSESILERTRVIADAGIPVMGHLGLVPQSVNALSGYRVQGREEADADRMLALAEGLQRAGAFSLVLECVPSLLATRISRAVDIPTIGIGAGAGCDGQVLVMHDLLGLNEEAPRFSKAYADLRAGVARAFRKFARDVRERRFPDGEHSFD
jgi:3-methyl-2-oxobutanoate hydroxymethyltransferase